MADSRRFRVLIVDDEPPICALVERILAAGGYETAVASGGDTALSLAATDDPLDMLVTDLMMPEMKGDELARRVRHLRPETKVLYVTGYRDLLFSMRPVLWDDEAFIEKPFTAERLREAVSLSLFGHTRGPG
jgi:two-component system, cell cycle sensor histidine kinase and response regulator CckA